MPDSDSIFDLFLICHPDDMDFARRLSETLAESGVDCHYADESGESDAGQQALQELVLRAHVVAVVLSPASAGSQLCNTLIEFSVASGKRFLSLIIDQDIKVDVHPAIAQNPYLFFLEDETLATAAARLPPYLSQDDHLRSHTEFLLRAHQWQRNDRASKHLLPPERADEARQWLADGADRRPKPSPLQVEYIHASRRTPPRQWRVPKLALIGIALVIVLIGLVVFARQLEQEQSQADLLASSRQTRQASTQQAIAAAMSATAEGDSAAQLLDRLAATSASLRDEILSAALIQADEATKIAALSATQSAESRAQATNARAAEIASLRQEVSAQALLNGAKRALDAGDAELALALAWEAGDKLEQPLQALPVLQAAAALTPLLILDDVASFELHPQGEKIAVLYGDGLRGAILDGDSGDLAYEVSGADDAIKAMAFNHDGSLLALGFADGMLEIYDSDGESIQRIAAHENRLDALAFSRAGRQVISAGDTPRLAAWNALTGKRIAKADAAADSPIDALLLTAGDERLIAWSTVDDKPFMEQFDAAALQPIEPDAAGLVYLGYDAAGRIAYSGGRSLPAFPGDGNTGDLRLWHAASGQEIARLGDGFNWSLLGGDGLTSTTDSLRFIAIGADEALLGIEDSLGARRNVFVSLADGAALRSFDDDFAATLTSAHLLDDGVISAADDKRLVLWSPEDGAAIRDIGSLDETLTSIRVADDGSLIAGLTAESRLYVWRKDRALLRSIRSARPGATLADMGDSLLILDDAGVGISTIAGAERLRIDDAVLASMDSAGDHLAVYADDTVSLYAVDAGERLASWTLAAAIDDLRLSPAGDKLLAASDDGAIWLLQGEASQALRLSADLGGLIDSSFASASDEFAILRQAGLSLWNGRGEGPAATYSVASSAEIEPRQISIALDAAGDGVTVFARFEAGLAALSRLSAEGREWTRTFVDIAAGALSDNGAYLTLLRGAGDIEILRLPGGEGVKAIATSLQQAHQLRYLPSVDRLFVASGKSLLVYEGEFQIADFLHPRELREFSVSGSGDHVLTRDAGGRLRLWQVEGGDESLRRIGNESDPRQLTCAEREAYLALPLCE